MLADAYEGLGDDEYYPVTYMNSAANLKAFCGRNGGIVCTSSNAPAVINWAFKQGKRVLFFPENTLAAILDSNMASLSSR